MLCDNAPLLLPDCTYLCVSPPVSRGHRTGHTAWNPTHTCTSQLPGVWCPSPSQIRTSRRTSKTGHSGSTRLQLLRRWALRASTGQRSQRGGRLGPLVR